MKKLTNKSCAILFVLCLALTMMLSALMGLTTDAAMTVYGCAALLVGALCSVIAAALIDRLGARV